MRKGSGGETVRRKEKKKMYIPLTNE